MRHWLVEVCGERIIALGNTEQEAKTFAMRKYFDLHPEKVGKAEHLTAPCQWGGECPNNGMVACSDCWQYYREE